MKDKKGYAILLLAKRTRRVLMIHIEDGKAKKQFICSDVKKNVFLIGDSIRLGYCASVREALSDISEVFYVAENCRNTQYVITSLNSWVNMFSDPARVDLVQFNCGHWDIAHWRGGAFSLTSETEYERNLQIIIDMISQAFPNAKIVFATTTTMNPSGQLGINPRSNREISRYNEIAKAVASKNHIAVNDLFALTKDWDSSCYKDYCHFTAEASAVLGQGVATALKSHLCF